MSLSRRAATLVGFGAVLLIAARNTFAGPRRADPQL